MSCVKLSGWLKRVKSLKCAILDEKLFKFISTAYRFSCFIEINSLHFLKLLKRLCEFKLRPLVDLEVKSTKLSNDIDPDAAFQAQNLLAVHKNICENWWGFAFLIFVKPFFRIKKLKLEIAEITIVKAITEGEPVDKKPNFEICPVYSQFISNCGSSVYMTNPSVLCSKTYNNNFFRRWINTLARGNYTPDKKWPPPPLILFSEKKRKS